MQESLATAVLAFLVFQAPVLHWLTTRRRDGAVIGVAGVSAGAGVGRVGALAGARAVGRPLVVAAS
jgi:hypothetical protein